DGDYQAKSGSVTIAAGETTAGVTVAVNGDTKYEDDENLTLSLTGATGGDVLGAQAVGTGYNDDAPPTAPVGDRRAAQGDAGANRYVFTVPLPAPSALRVTAHYATEDGSATAGTDYQGADGDVTIAPGDTTGVVTVMVSGDTRYEADEQFYLDLTDAT